MLIIKRNGRQARVEDQVEDLAQAIEETGIAPDLERWQIARYLWNLKNGPERFGEVDLSNSQQVALAAYKVKLGVPRPRRRWCKKRDSNDFDLVIVGAGPTAAYYLDTLGPAHDRSGTLVIGKDNPWIKERGHSIPYINHTQRQTALPSRNETRYGGNESFVQRRVFGQQVKQRIKALAGRVVDDRVERIKRVYRGGKSVLEITCQNENGPFYAGRVVFVAGSGKNRSPKVAAAKYSSRSIDMDTFIRDKAAKERPGRIVVWGSNAAIDAVAAAKKHGWTIAAWMYGQGSEPAWLPGTRYLSRPYRLQDVPRHKYADRNAITIEDGAPETLNVRDDGKIVAANVKYVVYGLGSTDLLREVLDRNVLNGQNLAPILDEEGVFSDPGLPAPEDKAFLGWGTPDGQLQVFGLAAENYEFHRDGKLTRIGPRDAQVLALKRWLSGDVLTVGQLTYIRSALRAVNHYVPGSIEHRVDFSHADANQLRVHLAAKYPDLPEPLTQWFIGLIAHVRTDAKPHTLHPRLPHGFTVRQTQLIERKLAEFERSGKRLERELTSIADQLRALTPGSGGEVSSALRKLPLHRR